MAHSKNTDTSSIQPDHYDIVPGLSTELGPLPTPTTTQVASITTPTTFYFLVEAVSLPGVEYAVHSDPSVHTDYLVYLTQIPASSTTRRDLSFRSRRVLLDGFGFGFWRGRCGVRLEMIGLSSVTLRCLFTHTTSLPHTIEAMIGFPSGRGLMYIT